MKKIMTAAIFFAILAAYPLSWSLLAGISPHLWGDLKLFAPENMTLLFLAIAAFSTLFIQLKDKQIELYRKIPFLLAGAMIFILVIHQIVFPANFDFFLAGCFPISAFLAGAALATSWKKSFPVFAGIFAIILLVYSALTSNFIGFPGNWNWNFTLTAITIPALLSFFCRGRKNMIFSAAAIVIFISAGVIKRPEIVPKGTLLALAGASAALLLLDQVPKNRRPLIVTMVLTIGIFAFFLFIYLFGRELNDYRIQLWRGSCRLFVEHPFAGCGQSRFEGLIPDFLPEEYHFVPFRAERHTHPHNEMLFLLTSFGITGVLFLLFAMVNALRAPDGEKNHNTKYLQWLLLVLFIHGMLDVLLGEIHTGMIFYVTLGALNALPSNDLEHGIARKDSRIGRLAGRISGVVLLILFCFFSARNFLGTKLCREAKLIYSSDRARALDLLYRAEKIKPTPETTYLIAVAHFRTGEMAQAAKKFAELETKFGWTGYIHSNGLTARIYAEQNLFKSAAKYFAREHRRFPFSIVNTCYELQMLRTLAPEAAKEYNNAFEQLLRRRGIDRNFLPIIMHNQYLDDLLPVKKDIEDIEE